MIGSLSLAKIGGKLWALLAAIGAAFAVVFGFYHNAKKAGILSEREKQANKEVERIDAEAVERVETAIEQAETQVETIKVAKNEVDKVNALNSGDAVSELQNEWARD